MCLERSRGNECTVWAISWWGQGVILVGSEVTGWTQPANLLSAVLLEEISLISWCNKCLTHRLNDRSVYLGVLGTNLDVFTTQSWPVLHMRSEFVCIWGQSLSKLDELNCSFGGTLVCVFGLRSLNHRKGQSGHRAFKSMKSHWTYHS